MTARPLVFINRGQQLRGSFYDHGNHSDLILFVHGFRSDCGGTKARFLRGWAERNAVDFACVDLSGHGRSAGDFRDFRLSTVLSDLETVVTTLGRRLVLVGSSMGGWLSVLIAQQHPTLIRALLLLAPGFNFIQTHFGELPTPFLDEWKLAGRHDFKSEYGLGSYELDYEVIADAQPFDVLTRPQSLPCPCVIVHGENDEAVPTAVSERFIERLTAPAKALYVIPGGDHRLHSGFDTVATLLHDLLR